MRVAAGVRADQLPPGTVVDAHVPGRFVVLWRTTSGTVVACDGRCPHQWSPLDLDGVVEHDELVCRSHGWRFAVDGMGTKVNVKGRRDQKAPIEVFGVEVDEHQIWIDLPDI